MRILMLITLGFAAACGLCVYVIPQTPEIYVPIVIGIISVLLLLIRRWKWLRACAVTLLGLGFGMAWFWLFGTLYLTPAMQLHGQVLEVTLTAADHGRERITATVLTVVWIWRVKTIRSGSITMKQ